MKRSDPCMSDLDITILAGCATAHLGDEADMAEYLDDPLDPHDFPTAGRDRMCKAPY